MLFLFILFCYFYADFFVTEKFLVRVFGDYTSVERMLLFYCFNFKVIKNNSHKNIVMISLMYITCSINSKHFYYVFLYIFFVFLHDRVFVFSRR